MSVIIPNKGYAAPNVAPKFPDDTQRLLGVGRTGSGKTLFACNELSYRSFDFMPWVILDFKGDELIQQIGKIEGVHNIKLDEPIGKNGIYIIRPLPEIDDEAVDAFLWRMHARGRVGIYIDELYMIGKKNGLNAVFTQGRSKRIPVISLAQRPAWITKFAFTESEFLSIFHLNSKDDRKTVQSFVPGDRADMESRLPEFYSLWYDVKSDQVSVFRPVPPAETILGTFKQRLVPQRIYI